jgi:hypothetical protein
MEELETVDIEQVEAEALVCSWRYDVLKAAGYPPRLAEELAVTKVDLHQAVDLVRRGCPAELAAEILL